MHSMDEVWRPAIPGRGEEKGEGEAKRREKETPSSPFIFLSFFLLFVYLACMYKHEQCTCLVLEEARGGNQIFMN